MRYELVTARTVAVLPVGMVRGWLAHAPDLDQETRILEQLIAEVLAAWESMTDGHLLGTQTWRVWFDEAEIETKLQLPLGPLVSVTSITSYDPDDTSSTVSTDEYQVVAGDYGYVTTTSDGAWPTDLRDRDAVAVLAIFGVTGSKVPYLVADTSAGATTLDDATVSGTYTGTGQALYEIDVTTASTTDVFRWRRVIRDPYQNRVIGPWISSVSMTGRAQLLGGAVASSAVVAESGTLTVTKGGSCTGTAPLYKYELVIDGTANPNTFKWRRVTYGTDGTTTTGSWTTGVAVTGSAQTLDLGVTATFNATTGGASGDEWEIEAYGVDGIYITWEATTGHATTDAWTIEVREALPDDILLALKGLAQFYYRTKGSGIIETVSGQLIGLPFHVQAQVDRYRREPLNRWPLESLTGVE